MAVKEKAKSKPVTKEVAKPIKATKPGKLPYDTELPKGYKPTDSEPYMSSKQLGYFRQKLMDWKNELINESQETLDHLREENWNEPDLNDRATVETETSLELRTRDRYRKLIYKIDQALHRIEIGEYGYCEETGEPIGVKRLEARPIATLCIAAQERHERAEKQYNDDE